MTKKAAYWECIGGVAGDMLLASLLDAGLPLEALKAELARLSIAGFQISAQRVQRAGFHATKVTVEVDAPQEPRLLSDVLQLLEASSLPTEDKEKAGRAFRLLAEAEAQAHGLPMEEVRLHQVGEVDALVDVVGTIAGLRLLGVEAVYCSPLPAPTVGGQALLAPATAAVLAQAGAPVTFLPSGPAYEMVTPTGAALMATLARFQAPTMTVRAVGYGAGHADPPGHPNVLRLWLGEETEAGSLVLLETNLDDMTPETLAYVQERLLAMGARDVWTVPVQMKKGRPGIVLSVLCSQELEETAVGLLLRETTTLGVRRWSVGRWEAPRQEVMIQSSLGPARVKVRHGPASPPLVSPEFEDCRRIAQERGLPIWEVYRVLEAEARVFLGLEKESAG
jgi:uncharacterized protein (TIGR00299 family) protein